MLYFTQSHTERGSDRSAFPSCTHEGIKRLFLQHIADRLVETN